MGGWLSVWTINKKPQSHFYAQNFYITLNKVALVLRSKVKCIAKRVSE